MWGIFSGRRERFRIVWATSDRHAPDYGASNELAEARRLVPAGRGDLTMKKLYLSVLLLLPLTLIGWRTSDSPAAAAAEPAMKAQSDRAAADGS